MNHETLNAEQQVHELLRANEALKELNGKLSQAQNQLLQSEKLASIGQLAAGVAHEINNPIGYVFSNFGSLRVYLDDLIRLVEAHIAAESVLSDMAIKEKLAALRRDIDYEFLRDDA